MVMDLRFQFTAIQLKVDCFLLIVVVDAHSQIF
jgi:hypothetical protein